MDRFLKRNVEADFESSQSNIDADEIPGTNGKKSKNSDFAKVLQKLYFF